MIKMIKMIMCSSDQRACTKSGSSSVTEVLAPEEQHVYSSPNFLRYPAPLGAACKRNAPKHMALRWSAKVMVLESYKYSAPLEHFAPKYMPKRLFLQSLIKRLARKVGHH